MKIRESKKIILLSAAALIGACAAEVCQAAQPTNVPRSPLSSVSAIQSQAQKQPGAALPAHLDLRLPTHAEPLHENTSMFPSATIHRQIGGSEQTTQLPNLGAGNTRIRPPLAELARHLQHEGLPIARLWENNSALIHLGLNQRGKPGLWLVQKVH
jgi:hypothetical protein